MSRPRRVDRRELAARLRARASARQTLPELPHETRGQAVGSPWCEADREAAAGQRRLCVECDRLVLSLQDGRCDACLGLIPPAVRDCRLRYYSKALRRICITGPLPRRAADSWASQLGGEVVGLDVDLPMRSAGK